MDTDQVFDRLLLAVAPPAGGQYTTRDLQLGKQLHITAQTNDVRFLSTSLCVTFWRRAYASDLADHYEWSPQDFERLATALEREQEITPPSKIAASREFAHDTMEIAINVVHGWKLEAMRNGDNPTQDRTR